MVFLFILYLNSSQRLGATYVKVIWIPVLVLLSIVDVHCVLDSFVSGGYFSARCQPWGASTANQKPGSSSKHWSFWCSGSCVEVVRGRHLTKLRDRVFTSVPMTLAIGISQSDQRPSAWGEYEQERQVQTRRAEEKQLAPLLQLLPQIL